MRKNYTLRVRKRRLSLKSKLVTNLVRFLDNGQVVLITSSDKSGVFTNVCPISWIKPASFRPPLFMMSIADYKEKVTSRLVKGSGEFVINIPPKSLKSTVLKAGSVHGGNKIKLLKLTPLKARFVKAPILKECFINIECRVVKRIKIGGTSWKTGEKGERVPYIVFIGTSLAIHYDRGVLTSKGLNPRYKRKGSQLHYSDVRGDLI